MKKLLVLSALMFIGCEKLEFYGDTFYTVKGKLEDVHNQGLSNLDIHIYVSKSGSVPNPDGYAASGLISASGKTDLNGNFQLTFPKSNGKSFLLLQEGYKIIDSVAVAPYYAHVARLNSDDFHNYIFNIKTIKITDQ